MTEYTCFDVTIEERIARIRMVRPEKRNSMIPEFWEELPRIVRDIDENVKARVIVISSTGPHFTYGLDIGSFVNTEPGSGLTPEADAMGQRCRGAARDL